MKRILSILLMLTLCMSALVAQTIYVMEYDNPAGRHYKSLVFYNGDDEDDLSEIRTICLDQPGKIRVSQYVSIIDQVDDDSDISITVMSSDDDSSIAPSLVFVWDPDETYVNQRTPYLVFDDDWDFDEYLRAKYFYEISFVDLNQKLIDQFYKPSDKMYGVLRKAHDQAVKQEAELVANLGDGSDIYRTMCRVYDTSPGNASLQDIMVTFYDKFRELYGVPAKGDNRTLAEVQAQSTAPQPSVSTQVLNNPTPNRHNPLLESDDNLNRAPEATMHFLFLANTEIGDIGAAVSMDLRRLTSEMKGVCSRLGLSYKPYIVQGENFGHEALLKQIQSMQPDKNDIVIFVYSGHGFRWNDQVDPYPQLALVTDDYTDIKKTGNYVALSDIDRELTAKGARLTIVLADCCNSIYGEPSPLPLSSNTLLSRGNTNLSTERLRSLFMKTQGHLLCSAAAPGEVSWCNQAGGNFTCNFIEAFRKEINLLSDGAEASWQTIIEATVQNTRKYSEQNALKTQNAIKDLRVKSIP